ncbi:MAG TPA: NAD(+) diphosphatase [Dokdonella sp.]
MSAHVNVFSGTPLERNSERRDDAAWAAAQLADPRACFLLLGEPVAGGRRALVRADADRLRWLDAAERAALAPELAPATYLGTDASGPRFALAADAATAARIAAELGARFVDLRSAGQRLSALESGAFAYARALAHWQERTRHCGACGAPVELVALGHRARCTNPACALEHFPRVDPAIIVIVRWRDRCLLGRQASWLENRYSTLAGFVEPGESLEDAVRREVEEEAGVRVGACAYHSSQPWPFPSSLMLGFTAEAEDATIRIGPELADARWFGADDLLAALAARRIVLPPRLSVSHELIAHWLREVAGVELAEHLSEEPWQKASA